MMKPEPALLVSVVLVAEPAAELAPERGVAQLRRHLAQQVACR